MKRINTIIIIALLGLPGILQAQNEMDALRYSQFFYGSTARSMSMGGAFTALGGDFSSLGLNPGGIGVYRAGEFSITPVFNFQKSEANYMGTPSDEFKYSIGIENLGFVGAIRSGRESGWISTNFGVGFNRVNNFNRNIIMKGFNDQASLVDGFIYYADMDGYDQDGINPDLLDPMWERLAYDTYIIDVFDEGEGPYYGAYWPYWEGTLQRQSRNYSGSMNEWTFSLGGNYDTKLYVGASLGIVSVNYSDRYSHTESDPEFLGDFREFTYKRRVITKGTGINFKFGAIYKPIEILRIGASLHLPTFYNMEDEESASMQSIFVGEPPYNAVPTTTTGAKMGARIKEYAIHTPLRANLGAAFLFGKAGLVSVDYEYVDYTTMRLRETDGGYDFAYDNEIIREAFRPTHNIRLGGEVKMNNIAFRGGYGIYMSPYEKGQMNENSNYSVISAGVGLRESSFFLDFGYSLSAINVNENLYYYPGMPMTPSENKYNNSSFKITFGFRF